MRKFNIISVLIIFCVSLIFFSCKKTKSLVKPVNYSYLYNPSASSLHPSVNIYHLNDTVSELIIKIFPDELLFNKANAEGIMRAYLSLKIEVREINERGMLTENITDSISDNFDIEQDELNKRYYVSTYFKAIRGKKYNLICDLKDNNRMAQVRIFHYVDKTDFCNSQNFRVFYAGTEQPVFDPKVLTNQKLSITHTDKSIHRLYIKYYQNSKDVSQPPFMILPEPVLYNNYDTLYEVDFKDFYLFTPENEGLYLFQIDTSIHKGLSVMRFYDGFPKIDNSQEMIFPLKYLASEPDYNEMNNAKNQKMAIDDFWLRICNNNTERARQLIRIYYNRVFLANYYFTSFKEGWTDSLPSIAIEV